MNQGPGPFQRGDNHKNKNFLTNHKARKAQKLPEILQIQVCTNHGHRGLGGVTMG
jgi:hypothetical protein